MDAHSASRPARFAWLTGTRIGRIILAAAAWTAVGLIYSLPGLSTGAVRMALLSSLAQWWSWGLVAPVILAVSRRLPVSDRRIALRATVLLPFCAVLTVVYLYLFMGVRAALGLASWRILRPGPFFTHFPLGLYLWSVIVCCVIAGVLEAWRYHRRFVASELRLERLERSFSEARLNALRMQLDPHFLFNALNTISSHVERDPRLTRQMIEHLGDLLRISLESQGRQQVPLAEEMAFLDHYLAIQKIRFGDQLRIELDIAPDTRHAQIPSLFIQPLVENAIRHGISRRASGGTVTVTAARSANRLEICVLDDGVGLPPDWSLDTSPGLGLSVTRERLAVLYPNGDARFAVGPRTEGGTAVEISLPLRFAGKDSDDALA